MTNVKFILPIFVATALLGFSTGCSTIEGGFLYESRNPAVVAKLNPDCVVESFLDQPYEASHPGLTVEFFGGASGRVQMTGSVEASGHVEPSEKWAIIQSQFVGGTESVVRKISSSLDGKRIYLSSKRAGNETGGEKISASEAQETLESDRLALQDFYKKSLAACQVSDAMEKKYFKMKEEPQIR